VTETLGLLLVRSGLLTREALYQALEVQRQTGRFLGSCLLALGLVTPDELREALSQQFGIPLVHGRDVLAAAKELGQVLPAAVVERYRVAPFRHEDKAIAIALYDPRTADVTSEISFFVGRPIRPYLCDEAVVERVIATIYPALARPMMRLPGSGGAAVAAAGPTLPAPAAPPPLEPVAPTPAAPVADARPARPTLIVQPLTETMTAQEIAISRGAAGAAPDRRRPAELIRPVNEISNRDFAQALGLEEAAPIPLTTRAKPRVSLREISGAGLLTIVEAAEKVFAARNVADIGEIGVRFLRGYFDRTIAYDLREAPAIALVRSGFTGAAAGLPLDHFPQLAGAIAGGQSFHGVAPDSEEWQRFYQQFGPTPPASLFVAGIRDRIAPRLLFYADTTRSGPEADIHEVAVLIREISTALSMMERVEL